MKLCEISIDPKQSIYFSEVNFMTTMFESFTLTGDLETTVCGSYDRSVVDEVWELAEIITGNDAALWRRDENGDLICRSEYGNRVSSFGWEIMTTSVEGGQLKPFHIHHFR